MTKAAFTSGERPIARWSPIPGQVSGQWRPEGRRMRWSSATVTGAVLPRVGAELGDEAVCLDLVREDAGSAAEARGSWVPLSYRLVYSWKHTSGILVGEVWRLHLEDGRVYRAELAAPVAPTSIAELYGPDASQRARPCVPSVQLRMSLCKGEHL